MLKRIALFFLLLLFVALIAVLCYWNYNRYYKNFSLGQESTYLVNSIISFKNKHSISLNNLEVYVAKIESKKPYQEIRIQSVTPNPAKVIKDAQGHKIWKFHFDKISSGEAKTIQIKFTAKIKQTRYFINADLIKSAFDKNNLKYLTSEPDIEVYDKSISKKAKELTRSEDNNYYKVIKIYDFVRTSLKYREDEKVTTALKVLRTKQAQCCDATLLFIALCRASFIPARYVGGFFYNNQDGSFTQTHSWAEVYLYPYGWVPVDPTLGRFNPESRYYCLGELRSFYIAMWQDQRAPVSYSLSSLNKKQEDSLESSCTINIKLQKTIKNPEFLARFQKLYSKVRFGPKLNESHQDKFFQEGMNCLRQGKYSQAVYNFEKSIELNPNNILSHRRLIEVYFKLNKINDILEDYEDKVKENPQEAVYYYSQGVCRAYLKNYSLAFKEFNLAKILGMKDVYLYNTTAYLYIETKQPDKAIKELLKALEINSNFDLAYDNLVYLGLIQKDPKSIIFWGNLALRNLPEYEANNYYGRLGWAYLEENKPEDAFNCISKAIELNPRSGWLYLLLGETYYKKGDFKRASEELQKGLPLATDLEKKEINELLKNIKLKKVSTKT